MGRSSVGRPAVPKRNANLAITRSWEYLANLFPKPCPVSLRLSFNRLDNDWYVDDTKHEDGRIGIRMQEPGLYSIAGIDVINQVTADPCSVSLIDRLPREILTEILWKCVPKMTSKSARMSTSNAPLLLCRVSSSWQQLVLATPKMWTTVGIVTCD
jgi:hypothetical protein